jgi:hypothetical protein
LSTSFLLIMAPAILSSEAMDLNIPAWKRLGLKLKSAQQESVPYAAPVAVATEPKKEKRKRKIKDQEAPLGKRVKVNNSAKVYEPTTDTTPNQSPITSSHKRRKSVTFTPETKTEDGDSIKQLYNGWIAKHPNQGPNFHELRSRSASKTPDPTQAAEQINFAIDEVLQEVKAAKKPKKEKKPQTAKSPKSQKVVKLTKQLDPALSYLKLFHESKNTWRFNKIHQINLLKNAFDVEKIPSEYIEYFYTYVVGLKGRARTQLRDAAIAIKVKAQEKSAVEPAGNMDSVMPGKELEGHLEEDVTITAPDSASKIGYEERVLQPLSDLTIKQRMAKRMRAERILDELAQEAQEPGEVNGSSESVKDEEGDRESQKRLKMSDGSTQKVRRKRKQRTNAVEDSSSSDSSDSDSTSEEEDNEGVPEPNEEESSSSSSSSSSASEDDEDSESSESESGSNESE